MMREEQEEATTYRLILTIDPMFQGRRTRIWDIGPGGGLKLTYDAPVPDTEVLCNGCNQNQHPDPGQVEGVYLGDGLYDVYCTPCRQRYFPEAKERI